MMALCLSNLRIRLIHGSSQLRSVDKALLSKLRKKTGFPFNNCKKALEIQNNDFALAEAWLREQAQKEGWAKATKLAARPMSQGLIGIHLSDHSASMVEVNCETDFVSRNANFQNLVSKVAVLCHEAGAKSTSSKVTWNRESLGQLPVESGKAISDLIALNIGSIGENMCARRAVFLRVPSTAYIGCYAHGSDGTTKTIAGKYGALVAWGVKGQQKTADGKVQQLGRQLAQHVVGMNPSRVGDIAEVQQQQQEASLKKAAVGGSVGEGVQVTEKGDEGVRVKSEDRMVFQEFLLDPEVLVGEFLQQHSAEVYDFARFECGEELNETSATP